MGIKQRLHNPPRSEERVDPVELRFIDVGVDFLGERAGGLEVLPNGFSTTTGALFVNPASDSSLMTMPNSDGGISR